MTDVKPMATAKMTEYFNAYARDHGYDHEPPLLVQTFTGPEGWRACRRPYAEVTHALVQELAAAGVRAVMVSAYARHADFPVVEAGLISPAYLA